MGFSTMAVIWLSTKKTRAISAIAKLLLNYCYVLIFISCYCFSLGCWDTDRKWNCQRWRRALWLPLYVAKRFTSARCTTHRRGTRLSNLDTSAEQWPAVRQTTVRQLHPIGGLHLLSASSHHHQRHVRRPPHNCRSRTSGPTVSTQLKPISTNSSSKRSSEYSVPHFVVSYHIYCNTIPVV